MQETILSKTVEDILDLKSQIQELQTRLADKETQLAESVSDHTEGSRSHTISDYKITIRRDVNRKFAADVSDEEIREVIKDLPEAYQNVFYPKWTISKAELRKLRDSGDESRYFVDRLIIETPAKKPYLTIKKKEKK